MILPGGLLRFKPAKSQSDVDRALRFLVRRAYETVFMYRKAFDDAGVHPEEICTVRDLPKLPVVRKAMFLEAPPEARIRHGVAPTSAVRRTTSGSSGFPLAICMSRAEFLYQKLLLWSALGRYAPLRLPLTIADVGSMVPHRKASSVQRLGLASVLRLPAALPVKDQADRLVAARPHVVEGFPSSLEILSEELLARSEQVRPRLVATRGEVLHESARELLHQAFGCRVVDLYGCEEGGVIACECPMHTGQMHVNTAACQLEVVDEAGRLVDEAEEGAVLLTNLYNLTMPFVRYELGDRALLLRSAGAPCSCGANGPVLARIDGRDDDFLLTPENARVSPRGPAGRVFNALRSTAGPRDLTGAVRRFQIVQEARNVITVKLVWRTAPDSLVRQLIVSALDGMWPGLECRTEDVTEIPLDPSGKYRKVARAF